MSLEAKAMPAVAEVVSFIKEQATTDLANFSNVKDNVMSSLTQDQIQSVCRIVENSIQSNFIRSSNQIVSVLTEIEEKAMKSSRSTKKK
ncbi:MAG: hypothetical protein HOA52_03475 [Flavobacteriales bacterium]|nr:hypothetical protein [Flavobacteriales bacterium]